ncbi:MAG: 4-alpha-glucanotransferase, partial [Anaerolineae bacterium]
MTSFPRASGILLHPTSLPGRYGIGDMGEWAFRFVDWLAAHDQTIWQVLPLNPTGYGDSPYQALSAFAGSPLLISLDKLVEAGWLESADLADVPDFPADRVDYGWVSVYHDEKLTLAHSRFKEKATAEQKDEFEAWCIQNASWLEDYTLFSALKAKFEKQPWVDWPEPYALRDESTLKTFAQENANALDYRRFRQWMFFTQWQAVKDYAAEKGIRLFGDLPIFVAHDSADVWADRDAYYLDERGNPTVVAGVPPD